MSAMQRLAATAAAVLILAAPALDAWGAETRVAVAANFTDAAREIGAAWEKQTANKVVFSFGATGQLYAQISQGAPFDIFLSADQATAKRAGTEGLAVAASEFTYAVGKLVLYSRNKDLIKGEQVLKDGRFAKIAIADPAAAPYGMAAIETMKALGVYDRLRPKIVQGTSITQAYQFIDTGNAELGFVALSQTIAGNDGSRWVVDERLYSPIRQDAILLKSGEANAAARGFIVFLKGPDANRIKAKYGYGSDD